MDLHDMHIWFRQYAQQMGMQNTRAILPEQIDLLINTSTTDVVNQLIHENIGITNDRVITDNSKIGQINAFRTLYKVSEYPMYSVRNGNSYSTKPALILSSVDAKIGKMSNYQLYSDDTNILPTDYLFLVDFSIDYRKATVGYNAGQTQDGNYSISAPDGLTETSTFDSSSPSTTWFPIRIIDDAYLADTLNDFVLKPRLRTPIMVVYSGNTESSKNKPIYDLYISEFMSTPVGGNASVTTNGYRLEQNLIPFRLRMSYIAKPQPVKYLEDIGGTNKDCDLPESMHVDILKHAVDLYRTSVSGALYATQQREDNNAREAQRNNYRNENN